MKKGSKMTLEQRKKLSESHKGQISWLKGRENLSAKNLPHAFKKGQIPWNKGKTGLYSEESKRKMIESRNKTWNNLELRKLQSKLTKEGMNNPETRKKISDAHKGKPSWNKGKKFPEMSGENHPMFGKHHTEETRGKISEIVKRRISNPEYLRKLSEIHKKRLSNPEEMKRQSEISKATILKQYESGNFPKQINTKPERQIKEELIKRGYKEGIDFVHQYKFMNKFMCDFCFPQQKIIIEVDGDFWHVNPKKYPEGSPLHKHQIKGINRDKSKSAYISKVDNGSWTLLRFWESDIQENIINCVDKIQEVLIKKKVT